MSMSGDDVSPRSRLAMLGREAWSSVSSAADRLASDLGLSSATSELERRVRPKLEKGAAALRWSAFGGSTLVPLPTDWNDPRTLLALVNLARVVFDEIELHRSHTSSSASASTAPIFAGPSSGDNPPQLPLPPVTCALVAGAAWRFANPAVLRQVCLSPYCVVEKREAGRLLSSCLVHLDAPHLLANLASLLPDAAALERREGSALFALDVALMAVTASGLFVGWAVFEKDVLQKPGTYYAVGAAGLSSLAFALQVVRGESLRGSSVSFLGFPLPAQFAWAAQLAVTHLLAPEASFAGHVCGVLAGIAHTYLLRPAVRALLGCSTRPLGQPPRFFGSGTTSGRPVSGGGRGGGSGSSTHRMLLNALSQLALAAATVGVFVLASKHQTRPPVTHWRMR